jgi:hypothetical protein
MSRRLLVAAAIVVFGVSPWTARLASAQDLTADRLAPAAVLAVSNVNVATTPAVDTPQIPFNILHGRPESHRSYGMAALYASTAVMQALDVHSSLQAFGAGAVEGNPMMSGVASHRPAFIAVKAAVAATTIMAARQIAKHNKFAAVVTLIAINSAYAFVASHNYQLARALR